MINDGICMFLPYTPSTTSQWLVWSIEIFHSAKSKLIKVVWWDDAVATFYRQTVWIVMHTNLFWSNIWMSTRQRSPWEMAANAEWYDLQGVLLLGFHQSYSPWFSHTWPSVAYSSLLIPKFKHHWHCFMLWVIFSKVRYVVWLDTGLSTWIKTTV